MNLEKRLRAIEMRNARVESEKAWEISFTRRGAIIIITYIVATILLNWLNAEKPLLAALMPTTGYLLSTLGLPKLKQWWLNRFIKNRL